MMQAMIIQRIMNILIVTKSLAMEITFVLMMTLRNALRTMGDPKTRMMGNPKTRMMDNNGSSSKCPNGQHKSPSGDCEKYMPHKGLPRCPNGTHRIPMELGAKK